VSPNGELQSQEGEEDEEIGNMLGFEGMIPNLEDFLNQNPEGLTYAQA
jgi:hypothetical protein